MGLLFDPTVKELDTICAFETLSFATSLSKVKKTGVDVDGVQAINDTTKRERKLMKSIMKSAESANLENGQQKRGAQDYNDMDLIFSDIKGRMQMDTLREVLHHSKICSYTLQYFIKQHFVRGFRADNTFYVEDDTV